MKGKLDVSNEDSHIPLCFLLIKYAAQFTPSGGGNWLVETGGGSDAAGTTLLSSSRVPSPPEWASLPVLGVSWDAVVFSADVTIPSAHPLCFPQSTLFYSNFPSGGGQLVPSPDILGINEGTFLSLQKSKESAAEGRAEGPLAQGQGGHRWWSPRRP